MNISSKKINKLNNGIIVVTDTIPGSYTLAIRIMVKFGSRYEEKNVKGIAHFIEHMLFKGTEKRTAKQIVDEIDNMGGDINAFTGKESTVYTLNILNEFMTEGFDILADMLCHSTMMLEEVEKERQVITEEIHECIDDPEEYLFDNFFESCFSEDLGHNILGTLDTIRSISREDLISWKKKFYTLDNLIISVAGNFDIEKLYKIIEEKFTGFSPSAPKISFEPRFIPSSKVLDRDLEQHHLVVAFKGPDFLSEDYYKVQILSIILGGGMSSRLFQEIREQKALAYSIGSFTSNYTDIGLFAISASTSKDKTDQLIQEIGKVLNSVTTITEAELAKAKMQFNSGLLMSNDSISARANYIMNQYLRLGEIKSVDELRKEIDSIKLEDIINLAKQIFKNECAFAILGKDINSNVYECFKEIRYN